MGVGKREGGVGAWWGIKRTREAGNAEETRRAARGERSRARGAWRAINTAYMHAFQIDI